jgi:hypothetical protein
VIALSDSQSAAVMAVVTGLPPEKHALLLERTTAHLQLHARRADRGFDDVDVKLAISAALQGLVWWSRPRSHRND